MPHGLGAAAAAAVPAPGGCTMNYKVVPITYGELH